MEIDIKRLGPTVSARPVEIFLVICYNLSLLAGASYLIYYKDASAWLYLIAIVFGASWKNKEDVA